MFLNKNLRYLRKYQNDRLSQEELALQLNISRAAIMAYESGRSEPSIAILNRIATFFQVSLENLVNQDLEKPCELYPFPKEERENVEHITLVRRT